MYYPDTLPKELRDELQYYVNYPYWKCLNELLWNMYVQNASSTEGSTILGRRYTYFLTNSNIKHITVIKEGGHICMYDVYYQVLNTELVTTDVLAKCINLLYENRFNELSHIFRIGTMNKMLTNFGCKEQIVYYARELTSGHKTDFIVVKL